MKAKIDYWCPECNTNLLGGKLAKCDACGCEIEYPNTLNRDKVMEICRALVKRWSGRLPKRSDDVLEEYRDKLCSLSLPTPSEGEIDWNIIEGDFWNRFRGVSASHQAIFNWIKNRINN